MFTGLIEACVALRRTVVVGTGLRAWIERPAGFEVALGQSIAVSGVCLTVIGAADPDDGSPVPVETPGADLVFDLSSETLGRTWFGRARAGDRVNLERALVLGDRLDGHLVQGHVDGLGRIAAIDDSGDGGVRMRIESAPELARYWIEKGSVTVDGVSLTVVEPRGPAFTVALIPLTLSKTSLGRARPDQPVNLEADMIGKWIERLSAPRLA